MTPKPRFTEADQLSPLVLAYVGDAYFELQVRLKLLEMGCRKPNDLHRTARELVSAAAQAGLLANLGRHLTEMEQAIVRRGRNAKAGHGHRSTDAATYQQSTGFEALIGYLYLTGQDARLGEVLAECWHQAMGESQPIGED
ncbi:MAG: ribonuclease III domain-containing protein [Bacillota bacterium]